MSTHNRRPFTRVYNIARFAAGIAALAISIVWLAPMSGGVIEVEPNSAAEAPAMVATSAYLVDRDIHVEFASGCLGIMRHAQRLLAPF